MVHWSDVRYDLQLQIFAVEIIKRVRRNRLVPLTKTQKNVLEKNYGGLTT